MTKLLKLGQLKSTSALRPVPALILTCVVSIFRLSTMDQVTQFVEPGRQFVKDSIRLVKRCTKPDRKGGCCFFSFISASLCLLETKTNI